ncbi:MAG: polymorphic toxin-type HINT domain-containing protein [Phycisphaeraceae bacterium]
MHRCVLGNSFTAGTGVVTGVAADGGLLTTDIATLAVGDVVLANDQYTPGAEPRYALVTGVSHRTVHALHHVSYVTDAGESETLETTEGHEFYARRLTGQAGQTGWLKAQDLQPGDQLLTPDGTWATVTANTLELAPEGVTVYNLTVSDGSTYYVDDGQGNAAAVWVHNCPDVVPKALLYAYGKRLAKDTNVYVAYRRGQVVYVGITKQDPAKRLKQHNGFWGGYKNFDDVKRVSTNITRRQARAIEQAFIEKYTLQKLENRINSISSLRTWYKTAIKWGADELPSILKTI